MNEIIRNKQTQKEIIWNWRQMRSNLVTSAHELIVIRGLNKTNYSKEESGAHVSYWNEMWLALRCWWCREIGLLKRSVNSRNIDQRFFIWTKFLSFNLYYLETHSSSNLKKLFMLKSYKLISYKLSLIYFKNINDLCSFGVFNVTLQHKS